ncbi:EamA family transporter RarD [Gordonia terrae]|uniref:EamA family transporter RarD n=1 Tax=Gordonia terrae TaxID=2055 RepID=A0AAD0P0A2_9ACTN|nr:EamA family transporter RarD [Gordonia terrae]VTR08857.1 transporter protein [Clostridioides difficile]VTS17418.1 putative chloramphenical resistance permease RarD [Gordonia terrae]
MVPRGLGGLAAGVGAYGIWGLFPAYFGLLGFTDGGQVVAYRVIATAALMFVVILATRRLRDLKEVTPRGWALVCIGAVLISLNWGVYVYAVESNQVVGAALGYFINPLLSVVLAVLFFHERLSRAQVVAVVVAAVAVVVLTVDHGSPPWVALLLAGTFAAYGAVKKVTHLRPTVGLAAEGLVSWPFAVMYLAVVALGGTTSAMAHGWWSSTLMLLLGPITAVPLVLFGVAAHRLPLVSLGLLQYLTPAMQMVWGVVVGHEPMSVTRWCGFALIWTALAIFSVDTLRRRREPPPVGTSSWADNSGKLDSPNGRA